MSLRHIDISYRHIAEKAIFWYDLFMNPDTRRFNPEATREVKKQAEFSVAFLTWCESVDGLAQKLEAAAKEGRLDTVMLTEYDLTIEDVNANLRRISEIARQKMVDIILAADNKHRQIGKDFKQIPWNDRKREIEEAGAVSLDEEIDPKEVMDSVGYFFGKDGRVYAFPKTWEHPLHQIPDSRIAVAVCGEIGYLKPEDIAKLDDVDVIYNPSREGDDPFLRYRMIGLSNPDITDEEIHAELMKDEGFRNLAEGKYESSDEEEEELKDAKPTPEEPRQRYQNWFSQISAIIREQKSDPSMYVRRITKALAANGIPVIRSDVGQNSGILNPSPKTKIKELKYQPEYVRMVIAEE